MLFFLVFFYVLFATPGVYSLILIGVENTTFLHTIASFSPSYPEEGIYLFSSLHLGLLGEVRISRPFTACTGIENDINDMIVLVERYGKDISCPYEKQAFEV